MMSKTKQKTMYLVRHTCQLFCPPPPRRWLWIYAYGYSAHLRPFDFPNSIQLKGGRLVAVTETSI